ncbi:TonB C-terminal domain-containing protein [Shimia sp. R11_0]|uniref:energy transducer TonB n=1 Tax=Shimia sp. R11_0 TaxID=2821096 RepID=UPI001ADBBF68|nr:energy transducer TonB [Shimia sp. R11_0]MBO9476696.1 TonB C-terminal domain-containing protein [Shimia sp. R11_0]
MRRAIEIGIAGGIAVLAHVVLFASAPRTGAEAGGQGGDAMAAMQGATPTITEMVQTWERPPETQAAVETDLPPPDTVPDLPETPQLDTVAPRAAVRISSLQEPPPESFELAADITTPPPPPPEEKKPEPETPPPPVVPPKPEKEVTQAKVAQKSSAGRQEKQAAGSGGSTQAGDNASAAVATASKGKQAKLKAIWGAKIRSRIARHQKFPRGETGTWRVTLKLKIHRDGRILSAKIIRSSGNPNIDRAAIAAVKNARKMPKAPKKLSGESFGFNQPLNFTP